MIACCTTWPAPPAADAWEGLQLRTVPSLRVAPRAAAAPHAGLSGRIRPGRLRTEPAPCRGVATIYRQWHSPTLDRGRDHFPADAEFAFAPGCFDRSLAKIKAGKAPFFLLAQHDWDWRLASYSDECLMLTQAEDRLNLTVLPWRRTGRLACREVLGLAALGFRDLSVGATVMRLARYGRYLIVLRAVLNEVSLVRRGAIAGAGLLA